MASKLDKAIATVAVAVAVAGWDRAAMMAAAAEAAVGITSKEVSKLPDRWYPAVSAKGIGAPEHHESWQRYWFEAVAEILFQKRHDGLPGLFTYWERDEASDHDLILIRLLRLAAEDIEAEAILTRVRARFATLHYSKTYVSVREVVNWTSVDPRPLALLEPMSDIVVPRSDGDTVGKYIRRMKGEQAIMEGRQPEW